MVGEEMEGLMEKQRRGEGCGEDCGEERVVERVLISLTYSR